MTRPESSTPDQPFPGARSAVPGAHSVSAGSPDLSRGERRTLPLEAVPTSAGSGWSIRLPVRAEQVTVSKDVFVRERVVVRRIEVDDVARIDTDIRREELRTTTHGNLEIVDGQADRSRRS